jgi:basic membrane protein A
MDKALTKIRRRTVLMGMGVGLGASLFSVKVMAQQAKRIALVMTGTISDGGWNQLAYQGLSDLKQKGGFETAYVENITQSRIPEVVRGYADDGFDLIIGHGFEFGSAFTEIAPDYPNQKFFATTSKSDAKVVPNLQFINLAYLEAAYAAGTLAALISEKKKAVGFVGGGDNPTQQAMNKAFIGGAEHAVEGLKGLGVVTGDYNNPAKGKEAALTMIGNGADVIWHAADVTGLGALQGAAAAGVKVIGCYANQTALAPDRMATSFVMNLRWMVNELGHSLAAGKFAGGTIWSPTVKQLWVPTYGEGDKIVAFNTKLVDSDAQSKFMATFEDLAAGKIHLEQYR